MDFDGCPLDFSLDSDDHLSPSNDSTWPPRFLSNCPPVWLEPTSPISLLSKSDFPSYSCFMEARKREDTIDDLLTQQNVLKNEVRELHRQNFLLETDKHKLINELINLGISSSAKMHDNDGLDEDHVDEQLPSKPDDRDDIIASLQAKLAEAQSKCTELEKASVQSAERVFELDIEKQRLNIKLHHYTQITKNLEEVNDELDKELGDIKKENKALKEKMAKLEEKIERLEEGDFEHVDRQDGDMIIDVV